MVRIRLDFGAPFNEKPETSSAFGPWQGLSKYGEGADGHDLCDPSLFASGLGIFFLNIAQSSKEPFIYFRRRLIVEYSAIQK